MPVRVPSAASALTEPYETAREEMPRPGGNIGCHMNGVHEQVVAADLGGTWMRAAAVSSDGACGPVARRPTVAARPAGELAADLLAVVQEAQSQAGIELRAVSGLAVAIASVLNRDGRISFAPNLPTLEGVDLGGQLEEALGLPVTMANDASCFAVGEWWMGAGRGSRDLCGITLGTGIGVGIVIGGRLYEGSHGYAGEIWNTPMESTFLENSVCGAAIERHYERLSGRASGGSEIAGLADRGDEAAVGAFTEFGRSLGAVVAFLVNVLDPEVVVFGGAIASSFRHFRQPVAETLAATTTRGSDTRLEVSALGEVATLLGVANIFREWRGRDRE